LLHACFNKPTQPTVLSFVDKNLPSNSPSLVETTARKATSIARKVNARAIWVVARLLKSRNVLKLKK